MPDTDDIDLSRCVVGSSHKRLRGIGLMVALVRLSKLPGVATIKLSNGGFAVVDEDIAADLQRWSWRGDGKGYAYRVGRRTKVGPKYIYEVGRERRQRSKWVGGTIPMHREILGLASGADDSVKTHGHHRNHIGLDNRRSNLKPLVASRHLSLHRRGLI